MLGSLVCVLLAAPPAASRTVTLAELVELAAQRDPERAVAEAERRGALAAEDLAHWTRWSPKITGTGTFGVVPGARGDIFQSPDTPRDLDNFGPFWRARLDLSIPLLSFGRIGSAERAAHTAVASREAKLRVRSAVVADLAARAYFGYLLGRESLALIEEVRAHLARHLATLEKSEETEAADLYRVRSYSFQLDRLESEARRGQAEADLGLRLLAGDDVTPAGSLKPVADDGPDVDVEQAVAGSPALREAALGAEAKRLQARSEEERWPALALEGRFDYGRAPGRDPQHNPFVYDAFNVRTIGAALAVKWDLNFKQTSARAARAQAEADAARAKSDALATLLRLEMGRAHARIEEARRSYETSRRALGTTASWLKLAEENHGLGTGSTRDLVDAYAAYLQARSAHLRAIHDLDVAAVAWRSAAGQALPEESR